MLSGIFAFIRHQVFGAPPSSEIEDLARALIAEHGDEAYYIARDRSRVRNRSARRKWSQVASRVADLTGKVIGLRASDRWLEP